MDKYINYIKRRVEGRLATIKEKYFFRIFLIIEKLKKLEVLDKVNLV